jgi:hypothetical protein
MTTTLTLSIPLIAPGTYNCAIVGTCRDSGLIGKCSFPITVLGTLSYSAPSVNFIPNSVTQITYGTSVFTLQLLNNDAQPAIIGLEAHLPYPMTSSISSVNNAMNGLSNTTITMTVTVPNSIQPGTYQLGVKANTNVSKLSSIGYIMVNLA